MSVTGTEAILLRLASIFAFVALACPSVTLACQFHGYIPQQTIVDRMLASDHIVLAQPAPEDPYRFMAVEALAGGLANVDIPYLVDSASRRRMAANPEHRVLFARDPTDGTWRQLAYLDRDYRALIDHVVARLPDWEAGHDADRYQLFADLHDHPNTRIRTLALFELDRMDYGTLRTLAIRPNAAAIRARFDKPSEMHLRSIRVLLIGLSDDPETRAFLTSGLSTMNRWDRPLVGAYATAWLEHEGAEAAHALATHYLNAPTTSSAAQEMIVEAMAIHSQSGDPATQQAIADLLPTALDHVPDLAPVIARQFGARADWSQRDALAAILEQGWLSAPTDVITVSHYVALAAASADATQLRDFRNLKSRRQNIDF